MKIFYFVHVTGTDIGISGIPRVVRNLARELTRMPDVEFVPVSWRRDLQALVHTEQKLLDNLSRSRGPELTATAQARRPAEPSPGDWLLIAEAPHLQSHYPDYPSVHLDEAIGDAVQRGFKVALVFHDILPLIFGVGRKLGQPFVELSPTDLPSRGDNVERLAFSRYAHATALADVVFPVSRTAGETLRDWLLRHGHRARRLPPIATALLPEEDFGAKRINPLEQPVASEGPIEFVALGLVNAQKNQLAAMAAFTNLLETRPDLDLRLNIVGLIEPDVAAAVSLMVKRAGGRIVLHGRLSDGQIRDLVARSRASVFLSLAEGFGLPVAESLWRGKPCLCSNAGSIAEIARGGGCLMVDPRSIDAICAGFETLATDTQRYDALLQEIAARPFKTWSRYARQIVDALSAADAGLTPEIVEDDAAGLPADAAPDAGSNEDEDDYRKVALIIPAADLVISGAFAGANRSRSLFHGGAIHYDAARDGAVNQETLFFGPYVSLPAGRYAFKFDGELDGELKLALTAQNGATRIVDATLSNFAERIVFELPEAVERFEIVGVRTPLLRSLTLRCAYGELRGPGWEADEVAAEEPAFDGPAPSQLPFTIPASRMRVPDAYSSGRRNRLRDGAAIAFEHARHGDVPETTLFFGPYIRLEPGRYHLRFDGKLEGSLHLRLTRDFGGDCLRELVLTSFEAPVLLEIDEPAENFEAVGRWTEDTRSMRLKGIEIAAAPAAEKGWDRRGDTPAQKAKGSLLARVLGRT
jgi:glycosyltransferase involved in cell wall biosynthesis